MADNCGVHGELAFCHSCQNEWARERHGLRCPQCHSDFVEVIERTHDPRDAHIEEYWQPPSPPPPHPLHSHNPWPEAPDPDESDIEHIEWNAGPQRLHFTRTSYRSSSPAINRGGGPPVPDPIVQTVASLLEGFSGGLNRQHPTMRGTESPRNIPPTLFGSFGGTGPRLHPGPAFPPMSPLQEGPARQGFGGRNVYTATAQLRPRDATNPQPQIIPDDLPGLLGNILQGLHGIDGHGGPGGDDPMHPFTLLTTLLNPANATHGDAVYTQEALDRVISQLMEQHSGSSAPGPAPAAAINALPKKPVDKTMMGSDGKAECSVCMDNVEIGDEVTVLPCNHWFHGPCGSHPRTGQQTPPGPPDSNPDTAAPRSAPAWKAADGTP
ncbi:Zinc finger, RING/FYVE/PHD-type [Lasallia pustulata]|uniref:Zinc finger, RING/FYVE/PHD-type n=1 Tax=Lasallia pustulata TaxID=136370 RepID=A0A1W5D8H0_9LECA|nr:Zinc finger, RING/FYVE/PHD-type [Lasallia pustulata]